MIIGILLHCRPVKYNWTIQFMDPRHCFNLKPFAIAITACGLALSVLTWTLPHFVVWRLQLRLAHKVAITVIFAFSLLSENLHLAICAPLLTPMSVTLLSAVCI
jgi:hypothetical protein